MQQELRKIPKICLGRADRVNRAGRVSHRLIGDASITADQHRRLGLLQELSVSHVVGRQNSKDRVILTVATVHPQLAPGDHGSIRRSRRGRRVVDILWRWSPRRAQVGASSRNQREGEQGGQRHHL